MDRIESLTNTLSQITMYDIKSMYNQAKNVVLNVSEMEAKVRDATNDEPWGASSTLMQEIAQGTFNFQNFNEIMPCIYARFMEKEAKQWRQIYKALQLLEYLVKNGSERVVDDARSHIATIKMLRNFYYIDEKGKDQGLNVRNRSRELVELLGDVEKIRAERRKAKTNKNKYIGTGNDGGMSFNSGGGRYGGFGSDSFYSGGGGGGSSSGGGYGGRSEDYSGGGSRDYDNYSGGGGSGGFRDSSSRKTYDEYDAGDDDVVTARRSNSVSSPTSGGGPRRSSTQPTSSSNAPAPAPKAQPAPVVDLLGMDDDFGAPVAAPPPATNKALPSVNNSLFDNDDDFGGFQDASPAPAPAFTAAPVAAPTQPSVGASIAKPMSPPLVPQQPAQANANLFGMLGSATSATSPPLGAARQQSYMAPTQPQNNLYGGSSMMAPAAAPSRSAPGFGAASPKPTTPAASKGSGNFDDLWSMSLGGSSAKPATGTAQNKSIKDLAQEKAQAGIWGNGPPAGSGFGSFGGAPANNAAPPSSSSGGIDDLLF
ncbi:ENTH-domain-containing protein [Cristinia sonorae]|uniref:ENTH-domain-containing protein n=1 Tax=Cristinia sonorae TaxID=1940300 RepID=A0A8K0XL27_9AGAR|nr:ENTH-domain-containing protein [Cristinia sonorae]